MQGADLERAFMTSRSERRTELVFFVNAGDPSLDVTYEMLRVLAEHRVATVELCVPFPNSLTDGPLIRESHQRALENGVNLTTVLDLVTRARIELGLSIVLLADYRSTVKPLGMDYFLSQCVSAGVGATLIHCLPSSQRREYVNGSRTLGLGRIMSFFLGSDNHVREAAYQEAEGFIYVVSRFGRTGSKVTFDRAVLEQLAALRAETNKPLAVGFGVKTAADVSALRSNGADAVVIGSAATTLIQNHLADPDKIPGAFDDLVGVFESACGDHLQRRVAALAI